MKPKTKKMIFIILLAILLIATFITKVSALDIGSDFSPNYNNTTEIKSVFQDVIGLVQVIGTGIAVIMLLYIAIKYLVASPEGKGELKKSAIMYVVAAVILFSAVNLLAIIQKWSNGIVNSSSSESSYVRIIDVATRGE